VSIEVLDNVVPKELLNKYNDLTLGLRRIRSDDGEIKYNTFIEYGSDYNIHGEYIVDKFIHEEAKNIWLWFKKVTNITDNNLNTCYINCMSYGDEGYAHIDGTKTDNIVTCIFYINPEWHSQWGAETVFYSGDYKGNFEDDWYYEHDIIKSVLPKFGRLVLFEGHIPHSVRPLSKRCFAERKTFMLKLVNVDINSIKKGLIDAIT